MPKLDKVYTRNASDLEQKYKFGKSFAEAMGLANDALVMAEEAKKSTNDLDKNLTSEEIFKRLTNNGESQGLYRGDDGELYINATYIKSGEFVADLIKTGILQSKDGKTFYLDLENGVLNMQADSFVISGKTVEEVVSENLDEFKEAVTEDIENLQSQLDGNITTWFYNYLPTESNEPASNWTTDEAKNMHLGDLFYVIDNETYGGLVYRWVLIDGIYKWCQIEDSEVSKALVQAAEAKDIADSKRRVFIVQPIPPYDVGDLWAQGSDGDLMRCVKAKSALGSFAASDWELASKYIDAEQAGNIAQDKVDSQTQEDIFNKLTENGTRKGVYLDDGELYVNATYVKTGTLAADLVKAGVLQSKDGKTFKLDLDNNTLKIKGEIIATSLTLDDTKIPYESVDGTPKLSDVATSGNYNDLYGKPNLSSVATSGSYDDLSNKPKIPTLATELIDGANILYADDVTIESATTADGITKQKIKVGGKEYTSITSGDFVLTDMPFGVNSSDGSKPYTYISKDGLLTAKNAMIYGTIRATAGEIGGCSIVDGELKIKAANITDTITIGQLPSNVAKTSDIRTKTSQLDNDSGYQDYSGVVSIAKGTINADHIKTLGLEVGNQIKMGSNAKISWNNVTDKSGVATQDYVKSQGYETAESIKNTVITKDYIETLKITAENISGTTLTGKTISGGSISIGSNFSVDSSGTLKALNGEIAGIKLRSQGLRYDGGTGNGFGIWKGNTHGDSGSYIIFHAGADYSKDSLASAPFRVYQNGNVVANAITCKNADIEGKVALSTGSSIGNFKTDDNSIFSGTWGTTPPKVFMCTGTTGTYTLGGHTGKDWVFGAGTDFGVKKDGTLYAGGWKMGKVEMVGTGGTPTYSGYGLQSTAKVYDEYLFEDIYIRTTLTPTGVYVESGNAETDTYPFATFVNWYDIVNKIKEK